MWLIYHNVACIQFPVILGVATHIGGTINIKRSLFHMNRTIDLHNGQQMNVRLLCDDMGTRDSLKRFLNDLFGRLDIGFAQTRLMTTTICKKRTPCPLSQLENIITEAKTCFEFKIFVYQFGQRQKYEDYMRRYGPCVVKNQRNEWDVTINLKRQNYGVVMCQRRRYAGWYIIYICLCVCWWCAIYIQLICVLVSHVVKGMKLLIHSCLCTEINGNRMIGSSQTTINDQESIKRLPSKFMKEKWDFAAFDGTEIHSVKCYFSTSHDVKGCGIACQDSFANNERLRLIKGYGCE